MNFGENVEKDGKSLGIKGTGFGWCADCGKRLRGIQLKRFLKNPKRRCMSCWRKTLPGFSLCEGYIRRTDGRYEHRMIAERLLGRKLRKLERVHHLNENKTDNREENLKVCKSPGLHVWGEGHVARDRKTGRFRKLK